MGYTTTFEGQFTFNKPLTSEHRAYLSAFAKARHDERHYPSIYCQWVPSEDGTALQWDGNEKFYEYTDWLEYLIANIIAPWGYTLNGIVTWEGERSSDTGTITIRDNHVEAVEDTEAGDDNEEVSLASDFSELDAQLKSGDIDKESVWVDIDEDIVRVFSGNNIIFSAESKNFVHAFFVLYGIDIDGNLEKHNKEA